MARRFFWFMLAALLFMVVVGLCGCRTQYVPVESVRTEYRDRINTEYVVDSVTDTRFIFVKGDSVIAYRERVKWKEREVHDTIYVDRTDSIRVPYPVERKVTAWETVRLRTFWPLVICVAALITWGFLRRRRLVK